VEALFDQLTAAGVVLVVAGERLQVRAPKGALPEQLRTAMAVQRDGLMQFVMERYRNAEECVRAERRERPCRRMSCCPEPVHELPCKADPSCCLCGAPLTPGRRYLCEGCTAEQQARIDRGNAEREAARGRQP
jgi:hypothetical protein